MYDKAVLVFRTEARSLLLPLPLLHWVKVGFEWWYLRDYRR
jgi:sulfide:quinone oxidoreductase